MRTSHTQIMTGGTHQTAETYGSLDVAVTPGTSGAKHLMQASMIYQFSVQSIFKTRSHLGGNFQAGLST